MDNNGISIPLHTPFTLTATATDADSDKVTYSWEEWDLGNEGEWNSGEANNADPLFKARIPKTTGSRTFPDMAVVLAGYPANPPATMSGLKGETLPGAARTIKFKLTVRDNRSDGGGVVSGGNGCQTGFATPFQINTVAGTGPFVITSPDGGESMGSRHHPNNHMEYGRYHNSTYQLQYSKYSASTDGGNTYPLTLLSNTPNDGSQTVVLPATSTNTARIRILATNNIFFDVSNNNFAIAGAYITKANGNWNNPSTWLGGVVPSAGVPVTVQHIVTVTTNASCYSLTIQPPPATLL